MIAAIADALANSISTSLATQIYVAPIPLYKKSSSSRAGFLLTDSSLAREGYAKVLKRTGKRSKLETTLPKEKMILLKAKNNFVYKYTY